MNSAAQAVGKVAGDISPTLAGVLPSWLLAPSAAPSEAAAPLPHLLVLQPLTANAQPFYFNLNTAAFDALQRNGAYNWSGQVRLESAAGAGASAWAKASCSRVRFPLRRQVTRKRSSVWSSSKRCAGWQERREPLILSSGLRRGTMGLWCLVRISENQAPYWATALPQTNLRPGVQRYGDDLPNR